jgi:hypothetical protein
MEGTHAVGREPFKERRPIDAGGSMLGLSQAGEEASRPAIQKPFGGTGQTSTAIDLVQWRQNIQKFQSIEKGRDLHPCPWN